jgi:DNA invertase Pin-like site-specific DNA recombinase
MKLGIAYYRVSTDKQGTSGLGEQAQREAVARYAAAHGVKIVADYVDVMTGKGANALRRRPNLAAAIARAKSEKARLVIAKVDRLARNVHFISGLMEQGLDFVIAEQPDADPFRLHLEAAFAEEEARRISKRTKDALAAAKANGVELGKNGKKLAARNKAAAAERIQPIAPLLSELKGQGLSMRQIVATLNDRGVPSPAGGKWHLANLHRALGRLVACP